MSWQMGQLAGEEVTSREQLQQQLQEAIKLSEVVVCLIVGSKIFDTCK